MEINQFKNDLNLIKNVLLKTSRSFSRTFPFFFIVVGVSILRIVLSIIFNHLRLDIVINGSASDVNTKLPVIQNISMLINILIIVLFICFYIYYRKKFQSDINSLSLILINMWGSFFVINEIMKFINEIIIWRNVISFTVETNALLIHNYSRFMYSNSLNSILFGGGLFVTGLLINKKTPKILALVIFLINSFSLIYKPNVSLSNVNKFSEYIQNAELINFITTTLIMLIFAISLLIYKKHEGNS